MNGFWILFIVSLVVIGVISLALSKWDFDYSSVFELFWLVSLVLTTMLAAICLICAILIPIGCANEIAYWKEFSNIISTMYEESSELADINFIGQIAEYNSWLANAKASQETYGIFSGYWKLDLSALEYITR